MSRTKQILDYFDVDLTEIKPEVTLTFDVHLYFPLNQHIMLLRHRGDIPRLDFIDHYRSKGISRIWIHKDDQLAFERYKKGGGAAEEIQPPPSTKLKPPEKPSKPPQTEEGAFIAAVLNSTELQEAAKRAIVGEAAKELVRKITEPTTQKAQSKADEQARKTIADVLDSLADQSKNMISEFWKLSQIDPDLEHAVNVATYAVIFAMAFGKIEHSLLSDLALAGLLHDVGISQVSHEASQVPWKTMPAELAKDYCRHVEHTLSILDRHAAEIPQRVVTVIVQHHEKFDGSGYPRALSGFKVDDIAQLLAMADLLDSIASGQWDGQSRTLKEAFSLIEKIEKTRTFPEHFNPEVFSAVVRWIHSSAGENVVGSASGVVGKRAQEIIQGK